MEKSAANAKKMRELFNQAVKDGDSYKIIFGYTEDASASFHSIPFCKETLLSLISQHTD